jgi:hypothetical protein
VAGGSAFTDEGEAAINEVAMVSRNTTDNTPAAQVAASVALGQFLKVCSMMLTVRLTLVLRLAS